MSNKPDNLLKRFTDKLFGGIEMTWLKVILFAVAAAIVSALLLIIPVFKGTSFARIGETTEAWVLFAVIIMANCKKPLESALKTFVFFLISQPLIYLFQVPFSWQGWGLFQYYRYWFVLTLLTFPAAFIGWYITKKNWLSVLIFAPVFCLLAYMAYGAFPKQIITMLFCIIQIILYICAFFPKMSQKIVGIIIPVIAVLVLVFFPDSSEASMMVVTSLSDDPELNEDFTVIVDDTSIAEAELTDPENDFVRIQTFNYGTATMTVTDGTVEYRYTITVTNDGGVGTISVEPSE